MNAGSGIISTDYYNYGFFSAKIKLPTRYTAGIVVAFYVCNSSSPDFDFDFVLLFLINIL